MLKEIVARVNEAYLTVTSFRTNPIRCSFTLRNRVFRPTTFHYDNSITVLFADGNIDSVSVVGRRDCELDVTFAGIGCANITSILPFYRRVLVGSQEEFLSYTPNNAGQVQSLQGYYAFIFNDSIKGDNIRKTPAFYVDFVMAVVGRSTNDKNDFLTALVNTALHDIAVESLRSKKIEVISYYERFLQNKSYNHTTEAYVLYLNCRTLVEKVSYTAL